MSNIVEARHRKKRSRVATGFHRLGILLAAPLFIAALSIVGFAWFSDRGPIVADPTAKEGPLRIVLTTQTSTNVGQMTNEEQLAAIGRALVRDGAPSIASFEVETGPIRTLELYWAGPRKSGPKPDGKTKSDVLTSITNLERRRGAVLAASEQPVLVGDFMVQEGAERQLRYSEWTHLKRGFDWEVAAWAGAVAVLALLIYAVARALGWVIEGFVSNPEKS